MEVGCVALHVSKIYLHAKRQLMLAFQVSFVVSTVIPVSYTHLTLPTTAEV